MPYLTRADRERILSLKAERTEDVPVPEWGDGTVVRVRAFTAAERNQWARNLQGAEGEERNLRAMELYPIRIAAMCAVDERGERIFSDEDAEALGEHDLEIVTRLADAAMRLSGLTGEQAEREAQAAAEKNSAETDGDASPSVSLVPSSGTTPTL